MAWIPVIAAAIAPGVALLSYFYLKDKYEAEPMRMVIRCFVFGTLAVVPAMFLQWPLMKKFGDLQAAHAFLISGGVEELLKWLVVYVAVYRHRAFDEPYDGILYAVSASLGFATMENLFYALNSQNPMHALFVRAFLPVPAHALFGVVMGYYVGKAKFSKGKVKVFLALSLFLPVFWHGMFNYILLAFADIWLYPILLFMLVLWCKALQKVKRANAHSPFRALKQDEI